MAKLEPEILRFKSLPSTNVEAARRAVQGAAEGLCVVAGDQTAGRGRMQRQWISPPGAGLYFSIILRPPFAQSSWPLLTLMAAVAVHDALRDSCALQADIKWPNDILADDKKLCGILAETVETPVGRAVVVGIGINLAKDSLPPELETTATSVAAATGAPPNTEKVLQSLTNALAKFYSLLNDADGPAEIIRQWSSRSSYAEGKLISVTDNGETVQYTTRGLERDGALRVETEDGKVKIIHAGDVTSVRPANTQ